MIYTRRHVVLAPDQSHNRAVFPGFGGAAIAGREKKRISQRKERKEMEELVSH